jgi:hypothetical protein
MVHWLNAVMESLYNKDLESRARGIRRYWVVKSIEEFVKEFRTHSDQLEKLPWRTVDFTTMYTVLPHDDVFRSVMSSVIEAWTFQEQKSGKVLRLTLSGWRCADTAVDGVTKETIALNLQFLLNNLYVVNGGQVRKQICGLPMGSEPAPQLANLVCYAKEAPFAERQGPEWNGWITRFIDDLFVAGDQLPSEEEYGMRYKCTSSSTNEVIYIGLKIYKDAHGKAQTSLYDRADDYPITIRRYPWGGTVAPIAQLGGVLMGRFVAARVACSTVGEFKACVLRVLQHARGRDYPRRLVHSVWTRFLTFRWGVADPSIKELRTWFAKMWQSKKETQNIYHRQNFSSAAFMDAFRNVGLHAGSSLEYKKS